MIKVPDDWTLKIGEKIWIKDYFYTGIYEFEVSKIINERFIEGIHDGIGYHIDINYYRPNIMIESPTK